VDRRPTDRSLSLPAGRVLLIVVVALGIAWLFNSEALVRAGEGMKPGTTRDIVLSVGRPVDDVVGAVGFHLPRKGLDLAFGQEQKTASGTELESGSTAILKRRAAQKRRKAEQPDWRQPTAARPLDVLVTGDSEAQFIGEQLVEEDTAGLLDVETVARNGTGLTNPGFFNWELNAQQEMANRDPDAVVMVIGGNDGFNVDVAGKLYGPTTPEWQTEFARRIAVVMRTLSGDGERPVYWVPPPTARDELYNQIYRSQNEATKRATEAVPGGRYVDIYTAINDGRYSDEAKIDGRRVLARQSDGIHFSREGAVVPTRLILSAMAKDYPALKADETP
jgi:uncharacterized protein